MQLSKHFTLEEFEKSQTATRKGITNKAGSGEIKNLGDLCYEVLEPVRAKFDKPVTITSGYRSVLHPAEAKKKTPGVHNEGVAADVAVSREDAYKLLLIAFQIGFTGIGVQQKGTGRFIHLDTSTGSSRSPRPTVWSY